MLRRFRFQLAPTFERAYGVFLDTHPSSLIHIAMRMEKSPETQCLNDLNEAATPQALSAALKNILALAQKKRESGEIFIKGRDIIRTIAVRQFEVATRYGLSVFSETTGLVTDAQNAVNPLTVDDRRSIPRARA